MKALFEYFVEKHRMSFLLMGFFVFLGLQGLRVIKRESRPPVDFAQASISTSYSGSSPEEIEEQITNKIENELRSVRGIKDITSISQPGLSSINITIDMDNVDTKVVQDDIQRALQKVKDLPADLINLPSYFAANSKEIPIYEMAIVGSNKNRERDRLAFDLQNLLEDEPGVSEVRFSGFYDREFQILLNPEALDRFHVGITEVVQAVKRQTQDIPAGFLKTPGDQKLVRVIGQVESADQLKEIVVRSNFSGQKILVKDIAIVKDGEADIATTVRVNGEGATIVIVSKNETADTVRTSQNLTQKIADFKRERIDGTEFSLITYNDESERISQKLSIVVNNALLGLVLVLVILLIFLPGTIGVASAISLPLAIMGTVGLMPILGVNFNNITTLAFIIAIGMLVDNAVVISENYARLRSEGLENLAAATKAAHQFWLPITATVATTIVAFLPMLVTKGIMGEFIKWIPIMVSIALSMSLIEAFFLLPARLKYTAKILPQAEGDQSGWFSKLRDSFEQKMKLMIVHRYKTSGVIFGLLVSAILVAALGSRFELFPSEQIEYYLYGFETPLTNTLEETDEVAGIISKKINEALGQENIKYIISRAGVTRLGSGKTSKNGDYVGMLTIAVTDNAAENNDPHEFLEKLRAIKVDGVTKLNFRIQRGGPPVGEALNVTLRSNSTQQLENMVQELKTKISQVDGVTDLEDDNIAGGPEFRLIPNKNAVSRLKLSTEDIGIAMRTALQGSIVSKTTIDGEEVFMKIRYSNKHRGQLSTLQNTKIMEPGGRLIPLKSIVDVVETNSPSVRKHFDFKRSITITAGVQPKIITSSKINSIVEGFIFDMKSKYPNVSVKFGGEGESTRESTSSLRNAMVIAVMGIFVILVFLFNSFTQSLLILSSILLGLIGVFWAFFLHGKPLSFLALIGVVGLAGVVVNSAIVLVSYINDLKELYPSMKLEDLLAKASADRLRAVMVTSLTTVSGLLPTAYGIGGRDSTLVPMTLALAWGLVSGTVLTIIWIPCGFSIIEDLKEKIGSYLKKQFSFGKEKITSVFLEGK